MSRSRPGQNRMPVLLVPGGGASARGYFSAIEPLLAPHTRFFGIDPPVGRPAPGSFLQLRRRAHSLAKALRREGVGPVLVIGHSLGALVGLRLAVDEPELVGGLLLLDPSPLVAATVLPTSILTLIGAARRRTSLLARHERRGPASTAAAIPSAVRANWFILVGGIPLAADLSLHGLDETPTTIISASSHAPTSITHRWHLRLASWIPGARHEVWPDTTHALHVERPERVLDSALALLPARAL